MKLHIMSDIHLEFGDYIPPQTDADVVILAGDISDRENAIDWAKTHFADKERVLYVLGNHEYWRKELRSTIRKFKDAAKGSNIIVMENDSVVLGDVEFFGATLWTDLNLQGSQNFELQSYQLTQAMNDYRKIKFKTVNNFRKLRPLDTLGIHNASLSWLSQKLKSSNASRKVVVTHHASCIKSLDSRYKEHVTSIAYASNLESFIAEHNPDLWVHGHVHTQSDYWLDPRCRVVCNPRGYHPHPLNPDFDQSLVIEL